ncbi:MAG: tetratricopeptide repeat protein [Methanobacteriota archaeon]|nr:MAG: tetratricopeptide repeat protein [Euryarchaeota archaeon]
MCGKRSCSPRASGDVEGRTLAASYPELVALTLQRDEDIDLGRAALLLARSAYPGLAVEPYLAKLDAIAATVSERLGTDHDARTVAADISRQLYEVEGFHGNERDYYDPRNSYLNEVIDRKLGIPITLSVIHLEVARRVALPAFGVGLPGHFLVKVPAPGGELLIDPFEGGRVITPADCQERLDRVYGGLVRLDARMLLPVSKKMILVRILNNLKTTYMTRSDFDRALDVVSSILVLDPSSLPDLRDRGLLLYRQNRFAEALPDLRKYLMLAHEAEDREPIKQTIRGIEAIQALLG